MSFKQHYVLWLNSMNVSHMKDFKKWNDQVQLLRPTWGCVPPQQVHTSPLPVSPSSGLSGPACGDPAEQRDCPQTRTPVCGGTSLSNVHLPPLQILGPGLEAWVVIRDQKVCGSLEEKTRGMQPDVWLQWPSMSLCLKAGVSALLTRSSLERRTNDVWNIICKQHWRRKNSS